MPLSIPYDAKSMTLGLGGVLTLQSRGLSSGGPELQSSTDLFRRSGYLVYFSVIRGMLRYDGHVLLRRGAFTKTYRNLSIKLSVNFN